jgi:hypothetical protein
LQEHFSSTISYFDGEKNRIPSKTTEEPRNKVP